MKEEYKNRLTLHNGTIPNIIVFNEMLLEHEHSQSLTSIRYSITNIQRNKYWGGQLFKERQK